jgi:hypothetical protein
MLNKAGFRKIKKPCVLTKAIDTFSRAFSSQMAACLRRRALRTQEPTRDTGVWGTRRALAGWANVWGA